MQTTQGCDESRAEALVAGVLDEAAQAVFEQHLLVCADCARAVLVMSETRAQLAAEPTTHARPARGVAWGRLALAASLLLAITAGTVWWTSRQPAPSTPAVAQRGEDAAPTASAPVEDGPRLARLAAFEPPPYIDLATRGDDAPGAFDAAMRLYNRREFGAAAAALAALRTPEADAGTVSLFLGIALLADARPAEALAPLARVPASSAHAPLAQLMIGRAHLALEDRASATGALTRAARAGRGQVEAEARALLSRMADQNVPRP